MLSLLFPAFRALPELEICSLLTRHSNHSSLLNTDLAMGGCVSGDLAVMDDACMPFALCPL
jgi:hypothetical protein